MRKLFSPALTAPVDSCRRRFLAQLAITTAACLLPWRSKAVAAESPIPPVPMLNGPEFFLHIANTPVKFKGGHGEAITVNGSLPGPILFWREGEMVTLHVTNHLDVVASIHWHGIILPYDMDGAPGISFDGIAPGTTFTYQFKVQQSGTYWYHSHSGMQEQLGLYGAIIIEPATETIAADCDYVLQLSDWTNEQPEDVFHKLKKQSDYYNFNQPTVVDFFKDLLDLGWSEAFAKRRMWNEMRMNMTDLADISASTYTYLINGHAAADNWTAVFNRIGERVRLRFINSGAQTFFDVRIPGLAMTVVQVDGQNVVPLTVDEIRLGTAETYDVIVIPQADAYTIFAQSLDRTGFVRATLATGSGLLAEVPIVDKPEPLSMLDMMGAMGAGHAHGEHGAMQHDMPAGVVVRHASSEFGASVDMRVDTPRRNLDDPGIGLRNNGRKVLTYADLRSLGGALDNRQPSREMELHLTGNMERYSWSMDGIEFGDALPIRLIYGERIRVIVVNDTMMIHPLHLHGMWSELESPEGEFQVRKHTLSIQPAQQISFLVTADAKGRWPMHCHLFYHMHAGMMREVIVA